MPKRFSLPSRPDQFSGPDLTPLEHRLVEELVAKPEGGLVEAAVAAGYSAGGSRDAARVSAFRALQRPKVREALRIAMNDALLADAIDARRVLGDLVRGGRSERVRLEACNSVLDRAGITRVDKSISVHAGELIVNIDLS